MLRTDSILPVDSSELEWSYGRTHILATQQLVGRQVGELVLRDKVLHHVRDASEKYHGPRMATDCCKSIKNHQNAHVSKLIDIELINMYVVQIIFLQDWIM